MQEVGEVTERPKVPDSKSGVVHATEGSNPSLSAKFVYGEVTERPMVHDWNSCVVHATEGSNPSLSAISLRGSIAPQCL